LPTLGDSIFFFVTEAFNFSEADLLSAFGKDLATAGTAALEPGLTTALADDLASALGTALTTALLADFAATLNAFLALSFGLAVAVFAAGLAIDFAGAALVAACLTFFVEEGDFCADFFIAFAIGSTMKSAVVK
jgi:hypothetical protein